MEKSNLRERESCAETGPLGGERESEDESGEWKNFRLPEYINPVHYDLEVKPLMEEDRYTGRVTISVNISKPTRDLWLHIRETRITKLPELRKPSGEQVPIRRCFEYKKQEYVVIQAGEELPATSGDSVYLLTMEFAGWLNGSLVGFYRTTYTENGQVKSIAATDHEPTDARKSFPCFDEPNKKATYNISIIHPKTYSALSNMPVEKEETLDTNWKKTTFMKSVPMSTYLVCFAVHQFTSVQRMSNSGKPLTIYVQPEQKQTAEYAANITKAVFDYFEEYFALNYSLPKLDKIAIPDFGTGAMENWGLITYRETNLLYDPNESASSNQQRVASVIAHELVHQWFGNIVTMDWWEDLWLNEGFASFFEFLGVDHAEADWQMRSQVLLEDVLPVQEDDSLVSSHPVVVTVSTPAEITSVFDGISYSKASNQPVKEVMDSWTSQMGYPVITVKERKNLSQKRFLLDSTADPYEPPSMLNYTWNIPIKWAENDNSNVVVYNRSEKEGITLNSGLGGDVFLKINPDHIGFYRVNYEAETWDRIAETLSSNHLNFSTADRTSFIDDAFALARYLDMLKDPDIIKSQDVFTVIRYISYNSYGKSMAWNWIQLNWDYLVNRHCTGPNPGKTPGKDGMQPGWRCALVLWPWELDWMGGVGAPWRRRTTAAQGFHKDAAGCEESRAQGR
ncbi:glutamyl aminopeptidase [Cricetulus griseus]